MFGVFVLPETRGLTLKEINNLFYNNNLINTDFFKMPKSDNTMKKGEGTKLPEVQYSKCDTIENNNYIPDK